MEPITHNLSIQIDMTLDLPFVRAFQRNVFMKDPQIIKHLAHLARKACQVPEEASDFHKYISPEVPEDKSSQGSDLFE